MNGQAQLALPGLLVDAAAEWIWTEETTDVIEPGPFVHETVMRGEVASALAPGAGLYIDVTVGGGGHTEAILEAHEAAKVIAFDRDERALEAAKERLSRFGDRVSFVKTRFGEIEAVLRAMGVEKVDGLCADLGVSSPQLDDAHRGMSFRREGPLDMRMDASSGETALELIARVSDDELADIIFHYGEEKRSRRIARSIRKAFSDGDLATTLDLRRAIVRAVGPVRVGGVDPATRTFQGLRIAVNRELDELGALLGVLPELVRTGGRVAIISFHSLEDRLVKRAFQSADLWGVLCKKPMVAGEEESTKNPRARSAKLRAATRVDGPVDRYFEKRARRAAERERLGPELHTAGGRRLRRGAHAFFCFIGRSPWAHVHLHLSRILRSAERPWHSAMTSAKQGKSKLGCEMFCGCTS
jgi:16S rRNA (cytosine1402-N4)-methyltransferase